MMDEVIHWLKPYLCFSTTFDEILSWMIEIRMKSHVSPAKLHNLHTCVQACLLLISKGDVTSEVCGHLATLGQSTTSWDV